MITSAVCYHQAKQPKEERGVAFAPPRNTLNRTLRPKRLTRPQKLFPFTDKFGQVDFRSMVRVSGAFHALTMVGTLELPTWQGCRPLHSPERPSSNIAGAIALVKVLPNWIAG